MNTRTLTNRLTRLERATSDDRPAVILARSTAKDESDIIGIKSNPTFKRNAGESIESLKARYYQHQCKKGWSPRPQVVFAEYRK